ncbi:NTP transferase domain-containing protein [Microbacterium elymi]|uniref:NTP transferase domain-containing protein n=1 Tax=Microbacterium elymi TaxID=2909587 RepID=A0ABY5NIH1_9MICO|nr:NTP transferase domain-containing protein [Microbacterium elymi]UUT34926.1 NTP transferase domain-containing protein [Microbacterium elymi]
MAHSAAGTPGADARSVGAILLAGGRASRMGGIDKPRLQIDGVSLLDRAIAAVRSVSAAPIVVAGPAPTDAAPPSPAPAPSARADPGTSDRAASPSPAQPTPGLGTSDRAASPSPAQPTPGLGTSDRAASSSAAQPTPLTWVREDPPFTGPVAAIVAALAAMPADSDPAWTLVLACDLPHVDAAVRQLVHDIVLLGSDIDGACLSDASSRPQWLTGLYRTTALAAGRGIHPGRGPEPVDARAPGRPGDRGAARPVRQRPRHRHVGGLQELHQGGRMSDHLPPEALDHWADALRERFGLAPEDVPISLILDLAKDVANGVARPAAPFSAFVAGLVAGRAGGSPEQVREAAAAVSELASTWEA